jgi:hypothetical protein
VRKVSLAFNYKPNVRNIINKVFVGRTDNRIGYLKGGVKNMEMHAFFRSIDWDNVYHKKDTSLIHPKVYVNSDYLIPFHVHLNPCQYNHTTNDS